MPSCNKKYGKEHPKHLIPKLCRQFYHLGWFTGTGGGMSIKQNNEIYIVPSGVQKECVEPCHLFVQDINGKDLEMPHKDMMFKKSQCTPLFMCIYSIKNASAVIHTHSKSALLITMLFSEKEFKCSHFEMIKGVRNAKLDRNYRYDEEIVIPIIENTPLEKDLVNPLERIIAEYPETCAVLVRRHGIFVWGDTWQQAKTMTECLDYLFDVIIQMKQLGIDPNCAQSTYKKNGMVKN